MPQQYEKLYEHEEPAHYKAVKIYDYLRKLYRFIREKYQEEIDKTFDKVAKEIGFVVTTTMPVRMELAKKGEIKSLTVGAEQLKGTMFDKALTGVIKPGKEEQLAMIPDGKYNLYFVWLDALKLKLHTDWMEPAHFTRVRTDLTGRTTSRFPIKPEVLEPAHWFDPGAAIGQLEAIQIAIIDEVYPELKLADRVIAAREINRKQIFPEVQEPAHIPGQITPGIREPAHFKNIEQLINPEKLPQFLEELSGLLRRYGYKF